MKPIKCIESNLKRIQLELDSVNGRASTHTITDPKVVLLLASKVETRLSELLGNKKHWSGAVVSATTSSRLPKAYKYQAKITELVFAAKNGAVWLNSVQEGYTSSGGEHIRVSLTRGQDILAIDKLRGNYSILGGIDYWVTYGAQDPISLGVFGTDHRAARAAFMLVSGGAK